MCRSTESALNALTKRSTVQFIGRSPLILQGSQRMRMRQHSSLDVTFECNALYVTEIDAVELDLESLVTESPGAPLPLTSLSTESMT
jgi:hypothetical protein